MATNELTSGQVLQSVPPGISWTAPPKSRAWQNPPKYTKLSDVANTYISKLSSKEMANPVLDALETKAPLASLAEVIMLSGVQKGIHTLDAGILVMPVIIEMLKTAAMLHDIKTVTYSDEYDSMRTIPTRAVKMAVADLMKAPAEEAEPAPIPTEIKAGLMQRKSKVEV
jgi:hypothetical protein